MDGGCSGCHMSFLDMDERLVELAGKIELVYSPIADRKRFPDDVDVTLVEGAICNEEHVELIHEIRKKTRILVAFGDCAVTGNVTALRNVLGPALPVLQRAYLDPMNLNPPRIPDAAGIVPKLLDRVVPLHHEVKVDAFLPGCPPHPDLIFAALSDAIGGKVPDFAGRVIFG
ncbi:MAG: hypothetical protein QM767_12625 [Anaeromyxobacter sp.]